MRTLLDLVEEGKDLREQKAEIHPLRKAEQPVVCLRQKIHV